MALAILADDLTGACDTGSLFARAGAVPVTVWPRRSADGAVQVLDTESRRVGADVARRRVTESVAALAPRRYFKKIDSTLRGSIGAEVEALMAAAGVRRALVCPAFPAQGRVVVDRVLRIDGTPVHDTTLARDPEFPRAERPTSSVIDLLRPQLSSPVAWIPLAEVRAGRDALVARLARPGGVVAVADAETDADLERLVEAALATEPTPVLAGAAGLARALARRLDLLVDQVSLPPARRWLVVAGSRHPSSRRQAEAARLAGLTVVAGPDAVEPDTDAVAGRLAGEAVRRLGAEAFDIVAVTGGDTAVALYRALDAERLELVGPPAPGLALGRLVSPGRPALWLVTKAGGFGPPDLFVSLAKAAA